MTLNDIYRFIWQSLQAGASPERAPLTLWQLATIGLNGAPQVRTVVLRAADEGAGTLCFHTDRRSTKLAELQADPRVSMVAVDPNNQLQLRIEGVATLCEDEEEKRAAWSAARPHTLILYQTPLPPGIAITAPEDGERQENVASDGYQNFALIRIAVSRFDYLHITPERHRRAVFTAASPTWAAQWVAP